MNDIDFNFADKVAVITGGASGIGAVIAQKLRDAGAKIVIWDMHQAQCAQDEFFQVDITSNAQITSAANQLDLKYGHVDFIINSAGITGPTMPLSDYDIATWQKVIDVNLVGSFKVCKALLKHMNPKKAGRIVNIASLAGKEGTPNASAYSASKAGLIAMTKSLGKELATTQIRVNAIAPAAVETDLLNQMSKQHVQIMIEKSPMGRLGNVDEVANMALWLCSSSMSFNTGAVFDLSGGRATY